MRETKGEHNGREFIKLKPDLQKHGLRGIVTAEIMDSVSGKVVERCTAENVITDEFYRQAITFAAEGFINGLLIGSSTAPSVTYFTPATSNYKTVPYGLLTLSKTGLLETSAPDYVRGEIAGSVVLSNSTSRTEPWAGNLRNPQVNPTVDANGNVHISRKYEFTEPKIVGRPFDTLYWTPYYSNSSNQAAIISESVTSYDNGQLTAINGSTYNDSKKPSLLPPVTYAVPSDVTVRMWGTRWADLPYCYARGYITSTGAGASLVIMKFNTNTGELAERRDLAISNGSSFEYAYRGRTFVGFLAYGTHPETGETSRRYMVRCNNVTGDIEYSAHSTSYPQQESYSAVDENGNLCGTLVANNMEIIDFSTGTVSTIVRNDLDIPLWLYPESGIKPSIDASAGQAFGGVDSFDVRITGTYFGTVYATYDYGLNFIKIQSSTSGASGVRYRGVLLDNATATTSPKRVYAERPAVMYKFPTTLSKNNTQIIILTYELVLPPEVMDVTRNFIW